MIIFLVGGMCSWLPYGLGNCRYAFIIYKKNNYLFGSFLFTFIINLLSIKMSKIPASPSLYKIERINLLKICVLIFVHISLKKIIV